MEKLEASTSDLRNNTCTHNRKPSTFTLSTFALDTDVVHYQMIALIRFWLSPTFCFYFVKMADTINKNHLTHLLHYIFPLNNRQ